jgi:hypothetical protein
MEHACTVLLFIHHCPSMPSRLGWVRAEVDKFPVLLLPHRYISHPRHTPVLSGVVHRLLDTYAPVVHADQQVGAPDTSTITVAGTIAVAVAGSAACQAGC